MKRIILFLFLLSSVTFSQWNGTVINLISDVAVTDDNDTLSSGWVSIEDNNFVELFLSVDDTVDIRFYVDYAVGNGGTYYVSHAIDSIKSTGTASTQVSQGKVLRGYGTSAITNLIPGANYIRLRAYFQSASEASGIFYAWMRKSK